MLLSGAASRAVLTNIVQIDAIHDTIEFRGPGKLIKQAF